MRPSRVAAVWRAAILAARVDAAAERPAVSRPSGKLVGLDAVEGLRAGLRKQVFGERPEQILTEETLETAEAFFDADLNLSVAARQMFVHRNTLTYRLDRIQRETGLDLRVFRDAVIFRLLMTMSEKE